MKPFHPVLFTVALLVASCFALSFTAASAPSDATATAGSAWETETQPQLAAFNRWAQHLAEVGVAQHRPVAPDATVLAEGMRLAGERWSVLIKLMHTDPGRVIAAGVPAAVRARLPAAVVDGLESPFSAVGEFHVYAALRATGGPAVAPYEQKIKIDGRSYPAHVYGRRVGMTSKRNIFLHGVLLGGEAVLDENILHVLPADEAALDPRVPRDLSAFADGGAATTPASEPVLAEAGGTLYRFTSGEQLRRAEATLRAVEAHRTPETAAISEPDALENPASIPPTPDSAYTTGNKKVLVIRVDFSDKPGDPVFRGTTDTAAYVQNLADTQLKPYYASSSYGHTSLTNTVTTQLYRMPQTVAYYATNNYYDQLHSDAEAAASANYDVQGYDRIIVLLTYVGDLTGTKWTWGGTTELGTPNVWINGSFDFRTVAHELGHTYGLIHANLWQIPKGETNPISLDGTSAEYGDDFDTIGVNETYFQQTDFNVWYKTQLAWVSDSQVQTVTNSGTYRVSRFDGGSANGIIALKIVRDSTRNYWIAVRRNMTSNSSMSHGVYITWGYNSYTLNDDLLDLQTPGSNDLDAALPTGTTLTDSSAGISITPVAEGGTAPNEYEDVRITLTKTGSAPVINSASTASAGVGSAFSYQITATNSPTSYGASNLPTGVSVNTSTGLISGTPTSSGTFSIGLSASNASGSGHETLSLTVTGGASGPPTISGFSPASGTAGTSVTITGTNFAGLQSVTFDGVVAQGGYNNTSITVTVPSGAATGRIVVTTAKGSATSATNFVVGTANVPVITSAASASATTGQAFSYQIAATNNPMRYGVLGLPGGLSVNAATGLISGIPKTAGTYSLTLDAYNDNGKGSKTLELTVALGPPIISTALTAKVGVTFNYRITALNTPTTFGVLGLPGGLTVNASTGLISGVPKTAGTYSLILSAHNKAGKGSAALILTVTD